VATSPDLTDLTNTTEEESLWREDRLRLVTTAMEVARDSEQRLRLALEAARMGTWEHDLRADRIGWSDELWALLGRSPGEVEPSLEVWLGHVHPEDRDRIASRFARAVEGRGPDYDDEMRVVRTDGTVLWLMVRARIQRDESGRAVRLIGVNADITDRKRAEQALRQAEERRRLAAEAANRAKDEFLAVLSHELRTPLTPVLAVVSALESAPDLPERHRDDLRMARRNIELEARLIDDLLDLNRIAHGKLEIHLGAVDFHEEIRQALRRIEAETAARHIEVATELNAGYWRGRADAARLQQVLWNLLKNAVKFTPSGGRIEVRTAQSGTESLRIEVADNGIGIDPGALPGIFNAFEQGDAGHARQFGGLGLGLAISRALVELHGGVLTAASAGRGQGAVFTLELPLPERMEEEPEEREACRPQAPSHGLRILLVEDHCDTAEIMARLMEAAGHRVRTADCVAAALREAGSGEFDVVVSDIGLPDGSGHDLMRELRARHRLRGIALSGYGMEEDLQRSREAGFALHLTKPVDLRRLEAALREVTGGLLLPAP
jgi:PAS domain S-box-containing protein